MKSLLLASLLVLALSSSATVFDFMSGFQKGLNSAETCADAPWACGKGLGQLMNLATAKAEATRIGKLGASAAATNAQNFLTGLITGLRKDNTTATACYSVFNQLSYNLALLYQNFVDFKGFDVLDIISTVCVSNSFTNYDFSPCDFDGLWQDLTNLNFGTLFDQYTNEANMCVLNAGWASVYYCEKNFEQCGYGIGITIRLLIGWGI